jgi:hypothetical protein
MIWSRKVASLIYHDSKWLFKYFSFAYSKVPQVFCAQNTPLIIEHISLKAIPYNRKTKPYISRMFKIYSLILGDNIQVQGGEKNHNSEPFLVNFSVVVYIKLELKYELPLLFKEHLCILCVDFFIFSLSFYIFFYRFI